MSEQKSRLSRREFLKNAGIIAGATVGSGLLLTACNSPEAPQTPDEAAAPATVAPPATAPQSPEKAEPAWDKEVDILVLGVGAGGTIAAYVAAKAGKKTLAVEAGGEIGGTALISSGSIHASRVSKVEEIPQFLPTADPVIAKAYIEEWVTFRDKWLVETGAPVTVNGNSISFGGASFPERQKYFQFFHNEIVQAGGEIVLNTRAAKLYADEKGTINGALIVANDGTETRVGAKAVILATGGWSNNKDMRARHWGAWADRCTSRCVPYNTGAGLSMALEHGAQTTNGFGFFYGHVEAWPSLVPEDPVEFEKFDKGLARDLLAYIQLFSARGLFINYEGKRFCDENGAPELAGRFCEAILKQTRGHVFLVVDSTDIADYTKEIDVLIKNGLVYDQADTIEALSDMLAARGVNKAQFLKTIKNYKSTKIENLEIPKTSQTPTALKTSPFIAIQITAAPSASFGGVLINTKGQVIGRGNQPIKGLYATACCAGGFFYNEYGGSLGASSVFGKIATETAISLI